MTLGSTYDPVMAAARSSPPESPLPAGEVRLLLHNVSWEGYVTVRDALDSHGLRMTYCEGELELMSPGRPHEEWKKNIARMVELFALDRDIPLYGYGSTTFKREAKKRGVEPDECYCVGAAMREWPEVVVEVVHTHAFEIDRRRVYEGLGTPELWLFERGVFTIWRHDGAEYAKLERSAVIPELDFSLLARFCVRTDQHEALKEWREASRGA
jgi:Uma2 family endonuclease